MMMAMLSVRVPGCQKLMCFYMSSSRAREHSVGSVIMMYSPDIPTASPGHDGTGSCGPLSSSAPVVRCSSIENYYAMIETEESVKCLVSSVLFFLVLIAFFLVAVLINPEMWTVNHLINQSVIPSHSRREDANKLFSGPPLTLPLAFFSYYPHITYRLRSAAIYPRPAISFTSYQLLNYQQTGLIMLF